MFCNLSSNQTNAWSVIKTRKPCLLPSKDLIEEMISTVKRMLVDLNNVVLNQIKIRIQVLLFESQTVLIRLVSPKAAQLGILF